LEAQHRVVLEQAVEPAKQRTLHRRVLEVRLDDDGAAGERIDVRRPFESLEQGRFGDARAHEAGSDDAGGERLHADPPFARLTVARRL
jgi:hypothetical protein